MKFLPVDPGLTFVRAERLNVGADQGKGAIAAATAGAAKLAA